MKKRFWLFAGEHYYPEGGMEDFQDSFDTALEAYHAFVRFVGKGDINRFWGHVYDVEGDETHYIKPEDYFFHKAGMTVQE